jgi:hypothetical protein
MNTDDLIRSLSRDVPKVPRSALGRRIAVGMVAGALVTALLVAAGLGIRPDLQRHAWLLLLDEMDLHRLAGDWRGDSGDAVARLIHKACAVCGGSAYRCCCWPGSALASWSTPPRAWLAMWLGASWKVCPWLVLTLAMPIFIGLLWSFRRMAPTRLREAGAVAGLAAGAGPRPSIACIAPRFRRFSY